MAFTPTAKHTLKQIDLAVDVAGTNQYELQLHSDKAGLPGAKIYDWKKVTGSPAAGTCCVLETVKVSKKHKPVLLKKGTQYWLVVLVPLDTWDAWNQNVTGANGNSAVSHDDGKTWVTGADNPLGAFDVLGK